MDKIKYIRIQETDGTYTAKIPFATNSENVTMADGSTAEAAIAGLKAGIGSPLTAATAAEMVDRNKVYVYTGNEAGYTNGNWYYHNGSIWINGGVYNAAAINTDTSLTQEGMAADAKATGQIVMIQDSAPTTSANRIWIDTDEQNAVTVPTYAEFETVRNDIAPIYSSSGTYQVGDYVTYNNQLYKCITTITTAENWTEEHWIATILANDTKDQIQSLSGTLTTAINEVDSQVDTANTNIGTMANLTTTEKSSLVAAINEVDSAAKDLKEDLQSDETLLIDETTTEKTRDVSTSWADGIYQTNGTISTSSSYIYGEKISVNVGDKVFIRRSDTAKIATGVRVCAYNGSTAVSDKGEANNFDFPYTVPEGIDGVVITITAAYRNSECYYSIEYTETEKSSKSYSKSETYNKTEIDAMIADAGTVKSVNNTLPDASGNITILPSTKLVTQVEETVTVQKQVVESQVDVVSSARNAANNGVLPSNTGSANYTALQAMLDAGGTIVVDVPGIYEIDGMLKIGSDTELIFGKEVYMKMMNSTGGFIVNVGASTNTYNENIRIFGLNLVCNGKTGDTASYRTGLRGKIGLGFVRNVVLDSIYVDDIPNANYFIHIAEYDNVLIQNSHFEGDKDGIHSAGGNHLTIRNCYFKTMDDPIALNCQDYPSSIPYYSWIKNVLIEDCVDDSPAGSGGATRARSILFYGGAWTDWASGNTYRNGDTIVASNDCVYRFISQTAISDATVETSTVEPTHSSGSVTESDGCTWKFVQDVPVYNVACENITIRNYIVKCPRVDIFKIHNDNSQYTRSIYPGVIMPPHKNFTFDNISIESAGDYGVALFEPLDTLRITNSKFKATYIVRSQGSYSKSSGVNDTTNISIIGDEFYKASGGMVLILCAETDKIINAKAYGNWRNQVMYNSVSNGTVNMIENDLFT